MAVPEKGKIKGTPKGVARKRRKEHYIVILASRDTCLPLAPSTLTVYQNSQKKKGMIPTEANEQNKETFWDTDSERILVKSHRA